MTEGKLLVNDKELVVPGETLAEGMSYLPSQGTYRKGEHIYAQRLGMIHVDGKVLKLTPLTGRYLPQVGDVIVARVSDVLMSGWRVQLNTAYEAVLSIKEATSEYIASKADLTQYYAIGDWVVCKIIQVTSQNLIDVTMRGPGLKKLSAGRIVDVNPAKVPRLIGKNASMVTLLRETTGVRIQVGQNGWVWLNGAPENENVCVEAIELIEREAHISGLTERVKKFLDKNKGRLVEFEPQKEEEENSGGRRSFGGGRRGPPRRGQSGPRRQGGGSYKPPRR